MVLRWASNLTYSNHVLTLVADSRDVHRPSVCHKFCLETLLTLHLGSMLPGFFKVTPTLSFSSRFLIWFLRGVGGRTWIQLCVIVSPLTIILYSHMLNTLSPELLWSLSVCVAHILSVTHTEVQPSSQDLVSVSSIINSAVCHPTDCLVLTSYDRPNVCCFPFVCPCLRFTLDSASNKGGSQHWQLPIWRSSLAPAKDLQPWPIFSS